MDPNKVRNLAQDSGVHVPSNSDNDIFEDADATDPPTLANIEEQPEGGKEIDSKVSDESDHRSNDNQENKQAAGNTNSAIPNDENNGGNENPANAAIAEGPKPANPNKLQTLLHF